MACRTRFVSALAAIRVAARAISAAAATILMPSCAAIATPRWPWPTRPTRRKSIREMIAAIGPSGAGKTVYLGMLTDMLSRQDERDAAAGPRSVFDQAAAAHDGGLGPLRISRQNAQRARPLELGPLPGAPQAAQARRADHARPGRRGPAGRGRSSATRIPSSGRSSPNVPACWCWSMPPRVEAGEATKTFTR